MKKLFLIITIILTNNIFHSADNNLAHPVNFKVTRGYSHLTSPENLYLFIEAVLTWDKNGNEHASIESYNSNERKELSITFFHMQHSKPIKVTYWTDNATQDPKFEETSIWGKKNEVTDSINAIFNHAGHNVATSTKKHLTLLEQALLCTTTTKVYFNPTIDPRVAQRVDTFKHDNQNLANSYRYNTEERTLPLIRQRPTDDSNDTTQLSGTNSFSPSPNNPNQK